MPFCTCSTHACRPAKLIASTLAGVNHYEVDSLDLAWLDSYLERERTHVCDHAHSLTEDSAKLNEAQLASLLLMFERAPREAMAALGKAGEDLLCNVCREASGGELVRLTGSRTAMQGMRW